MSVKKLIEKMTLIEKAAMFSGQSQFESRGFTKYEIPVIHFADGPHGVRKQLGSADHLGLNESAPATCFPPAATISNSWDLSLGHRIGEALGFESKQNDVQVLLGPGLNIKRHPRCGRNFEYFSEDPYLSGKLAAAYIQGIQANGTVACPKHFAVNSQETRRMVSNSIIDERSYREIYATAFEIAVKEGNPLSIMSAYNQINGVYANESYALLQELLRDEWGFNGFVVSDWGGSNDHVEGIRNGSHLEMPGSGINPALEVVHAVENGSLDESVLDRRLEELLNVFMAIDQKEAVSDLEAHHQLAQEASEKSIVLLKNKYNTLPLGDEKIALIGDFAYSPRYQGSGSSVVRATRVDSLVDVLKSNKNVTASRGFKRDGSKDEGLLDEAISLAKKAEKIVICLGLSEASETEGMDRTQFNIPSNQLHLLQVLRELGKPVICILACGSVVDMSWEENCDAIIHGYLHGQAGAKALVNVLWGIVNPSGKLTETYPEKASDIVIDSYYPEKGKNAIYYEGIFVGYRYYDTRSIAVKYPFGYGLSYTTFSYLDYQIDKKGITVRIKNSGLRYGEEIVQMYVSKQSANVTRPSKELKGFSKVGLEPGEEKTVRIEFDDYSFRHFSKNLNRFVVEGGDYDILIGRSSRDIVFRSSINVVASGYDVLMKDDEYANYQRAKISFDMRDYSLLLGTQILEEKNDKKRLTLERNSTLSDCLYAKNPVVRAYGMFLKRSIAKSLEKGKPNLNLLFQSGMPFRAMAKMTNGLVDMNMVDQLLYIANGHFFKGLSRFIKAFMHNRRMKKRFEVSA